MKSPHHRSWLALLMSLLIALASGCAATKPAPPEEPSAEATSPARYRFRFLLQANEAISARFERLAEQMQADFEHRWQGSQPHVEHVRGADAVRVSFGDPPADDDFTAYVTRFYPMVTVPPVLDGKEVTLEMDRELAATDRSALLDQTVNVVEQRLEVAGLAREDFEVVARENFMIDVVVPRSEPAELERLERRLQQRESFALRRLDDANAYPFFRYLELPDGASFNEDDFGVPSVRHADRHVLADFFAQEVAEKLADDHTIGFERIIEQDESGRAHTIWHAQYVWKKTELTSEHISDARAIVDVSAHVPYVGISLTPSGARRFEQLTAENVGRRIAIMVGDRIYSAPVINEPVRGGRIQLSLGSLKPFDELADEAEALSNLIQHSMLAPQLKKLAEGPVGD